MDKERGDPSIEKFDQRLRAAQARQQGDEQNQGGGRQLPRNGLGIAFRIGIEVVAALIVGVGIGWLLDRWLGTTPWLLIVFFLLGAAAGVMNVLRAVDQMNRSSDSPKNETKR